jgi:hypothetical protein
VAWASKGQNLPVDTSTLPTVAKTVAKVFDTLNFAAKESIENYFYALNGTLLIMQHFLSPISPS